MNKKIWMLWLQGWDNAPSLSKKCVESWRYYNPDWNVILLDSSNISEYLDLDKVFPRLNTNNISFSNIIRISLIKKFGGVWADSTLFCNKPLNDWLKVEDTFLFNKPSNTRMICDWFIKGTSSSKIILDWYKATENYWKWRIEKTDQYEQRYGWSHDLFKKCYNNSSEFKTIWDSTLKIEASTIGIRGKGPHLFVPYERYFNQLITIEDKNRIDSKLDPVYKLTYKVNTNWRSNGIHPGNEKIVTPYIIGSPIDYILNSI